MDNKKFSNPDPTKVPKGFLDVLKWKLTSRPPSWPKIVPLETADIPPAKINDDRLRVSFVGHVTFLIQTNNLNILTDPVWSERASPFSFAGPKRVTPPGINFDDLPKIDLILISHNHYDHLDVETIKKLWLRDRPKIITPLMNDLILKNKISDIEVNTLNWLESCNVTDDIKVVLEPSQHWSARTPFDKNNALWGTFIIKMPKGSICFIGDTGYSADTFKKIGDRHNDIFVSLIPIGAFEPRWFMSDVHINPEEAVLIHNHLNSKYSIASHFETFHLADDEFKQPSQELERARIKHKISNDIFITPKIGGVYWF